MRPNHLHLMVEAPGFHKLITSLFPEGDEVLASDAVFGVKKSLVVVRCLGPTSRYQLTDSSPVEVDRC
jgi:protocatechuate 3,4-dioxygenase beta subunit